MYILFVYTILAFSPNGQPYKDWVNRGEFTSLQNCEQAAQVMRIKERVQCLPK